MSRRRRIGLLMLALLVVSHDAHAQTTAAPRKHSIEVAAGAIFMTGIDFGTRDANLTANDPGDPNFPLFHTSTTLGAGRGFDGRLAFNVTRVFALEGGFAWMRQSLETRVTGDFEGAPNSSVTQDLNTYHADGALIAHITRARFANGRALPFVLAGAGYRRQLDDREYLSGSGAIFEAGGGVKFFFVQRPRGILRGVGLRGDGRLYVQSVDPDKDIAGKSSHTTWAAAIDAVFSF